MQDLRTLDLLLFEMEGRCWFSALKCAIFQLKYNISFLLVFIHNCDTRFFVLGSLPTKITTFQLGISNVSNIASVILTITERHEISMNKNGSCSNSYRADNNFTACSKNYLTKFLTDDNITCSLPGEVYIEFKKLSKSIFS